MHNSNKTQNKSNSLHLLDFYLPDILFYYFLVETLPFRIYLPVLFDVVWLLVGNFDPIQPFSVPVMFGSICKGSGRSHSGALALPLSAVLCGYSFSLD